MGSELKADYYDEAFSKSERYHSHWKNLSPYTELWVRTVYLLGYYEKENILDIGCGMGQFGQACHEMGIGYTGIDFSEYAISHARKHAPVRYEVSDALEFDYEGYDAYVSHEFLEHIEKDLEVVSKIPSGSLFIFSVPSFDDKGHVRHFPKVEDVIERYSKHFREFTIVDMTKQHYLCKGIKK